MPKLVAVDKDTFYKIIGPLNVFPSMRDPDVVVWENFDRTVVGKSYPGWKNPGGDKSWWLDINLVPMKKEA